MAPEEKKVLLNKGAGGMSSKDAKTIRELVNKMHEVDKAIYHIKNEMKKTSSETLKE